MKEQVKQAVDHNVVLGLRVIFFSFLLGVYAFLLIALFVYFGQKNDPNVVVPLTSNAYMITLVALGYMVIAIPLSGVLFKKFLKTDRNTDPQVIVANIRAAMLVRLAVFEGAALLAATGILLGSLDGYLIGNPIVWLNLVPIFYFTLHIIMNLPSQSRIAYIYESNFI